MSKTPSFKAREVLKILFAHGFMKIRISGSHIRFGTLKSIIRQSGIPKEKFIKENQYDKLYFLPNCKR